MTQVVRAVAVGALLAAVLGALAGCAVDPIEELNRKVESPRVSTREQAILSLANLRDRRAVKLLIDALAGDEELYDAAAVALVKHGRQIQTSRERNPVVEQVSEIVSNTHLPEPFRARAVWTLGEIGDRRSIPLLKEVTAGSLADATKPIMKQQAVEALEKLGFDSAGHSYELLMGVLVGDLDVIPEIKEMQPPA